MINLDESSIQTINPTQLLELITSVFTGERLQTQRQSINFSPEFFPDHQITDEETYLQLKQFEFNIKYNFLFNLTKTICGIVDNFSTMADRDSLLDSYYTQFKNIVKNKTAKLKIVSDTDGNVVSLILGTFLPETAQRTSYDVWGIPEEAAIYLELDLENRQPSIVKKITDSGEDCGLLVVSKSYLRAGPLELCGGKFNLLLNTKNGRLFHNLSTSDSSIRLLDVISQCQCSCPIISQLFGRVDQKIEPKKGWYSARNKLSHLVVVDAEKFAKVPGYVKLAVTTSEDSFGRQLNTLRANSETDWLWKEQPLLDKAAATKSDRYGVAVETPDGLLFAMEKTSKHREIRKKTENTKVFRSDFSNSLLSQVCSLIFFAELNQRAWEAVNVLKPFKDEVEENYLQLESQANARIPKTIQAAGPGAMFQWMEKETEAMLSIAEAGFKQQIEARAAAVFSTNSRNKFLCNLCDYIPSVVTNRQSTYAELFRVANVLVGSTNNKLVSFNDKSTVSLSLKEVVTIFSHDAYSGWRYNDSNIWVESSSAFLNFYLDNFIPQAETEEQLSKIDQHYITSDYRTGRLRMRTGHVPESDILIEECISISTEAMTLIKSAAAVKTYSELKTWWTFAKMHITAESKPTILSKLTLEQQKIFKLNLRVMTKLVDWATEVLDKSEAELLALSED